MTEREALILAIEKAKVGCRCRGCWAAGQHHNGPCDIGKLRVDVGAVSVRAIDRLRQLTDNPEIQKT